MVNVRQDQLEKPESGLASSRSSEPRSAVVTEFGSGRGGGAERNHATMTRDCPLANQTRIGRSLLDRIRTKLCHGRLDAGIGPYLATSQDERLQRWIDIIISTYKIPQDL